MFPWLCGLLPKPYLFFEQDKGGGGGAGGGNGAGGSGNPPPKLVPEADLLAVKHGAEQTITDLKAQLATLQASVDSKHQESASARAKVQELETTITALQAKVTEADTLRSELAASKASREELERSLLDSRRQALVSTYGLKLEDVKDYTKDQLAFAEQVLSKAPRGSKGSYDRGGGAGGDNYSSLSARDKIRLAMDGK